MEKKGVAIIGCGKLGTALGVALARCGYFLCGLSSRSISSAQALADAVGRNVIVSDKPWEATIQADIVFITTPDDHIQSVCQSIIDQGGFQNGSVIFHCSGSLPSTILSEVCREGVSTGSIHPVQSFSGGRYDSNPFDGITMSVEGDRQAVDTALPIVTDLNAAPLAISTAGKIAYHAAAVVASNYLVAIVELDHTLMGYADVPPKKAFEVLEPLMLGTLKNIADKGPIDALTGPISRGDVRTIASHLAAIGVEDVEVLKLYKTLAKRTIGIAALREELDQKTISELMALVSPE